MPQDFKMKGTPCKGLKDYLLHVQRNQTCYICKTTTDIWTIYPSFMPRSSQIFMWSAVGDRAREEKQLANDYENNLTCHVNSSLPHSPLFFNAEESLVMLTQHMKLSIVFSHAGCFVEKGAYK